MSEMWQTGGVGTTLWQLAIQGGPVMIPIGVLSVIVVALAFYCLLAIRIGRAVPMKFTRDILAELEAGGDIRDIRNAADICKQSGCLAAEVLLPGLLKAETFLQSKGNPNRTITTDSILLVSMLSGIREAIESGGSRVASRLRQRVIWFSHIGMIAPMLGLLGTVFGMIRAFSSIAYKAEFGKPILLASALSEAMVTTAAGLIVGIIAMVLFFHFNSKANKIICDMEVTGEDVVEGIAEVISTTQPVPQEMPVKQTHPI
ncbi:MAG: MotA/TolQ/ExbB proton channel family protein [Candidatus Brocadiales bacterium]